MAKLWPYWIYCYEGIMGVILSVKEIERCTESALIDAHGL